MSEVARSFRGVLFLCAAGFLIVLAGWVGDARGEGETSGQRGLVFQEERVLFTNVYPGERVEYVFRFRNEGERDVRITQVKPT